ncbi:perlucin [Aplysia californica]|uniref:Perlucin n=1 Tax=Aplysia californica TaxID=6500 RepID=A0ABM0K8Z7_APLCA|nr:perlucin [Aplysia californica]
MESNVDLKENILDLQKRVAQLECNKAKQDAKVSILHNALFIASDAYNGHHYYLTQHQPTSYTNAEKVCNAMGGYLAEVDTVTEFRFIQAFLRRKIKSSQVILLGGTDANSEGTFINPNSSTQGYSEWYRNQPDNGGYKEHCRSIMESLGHDIGKYLMNDIPCDIVNDNFYKHGYLCEVPSTVDVRQETCEF